MQENNEFLARKTKSYTVPHTMSMLTMFEVQISMKIRLFWGLLLLVILGSSPMAVYAGGFEDNFKGVERLMPDGTKMLYPDHRLWAFTFWPGIEWPDSYGDGTNWLEGNAESQTYLNPFLGKVKGQVIPVDLRYNPFKISEGGLHIRADILTQKQQAVYQVGGHRRFGSGMILSRQSFLYGRVDVVAKLPSARGSWPAIWMLPQKRMWPPEIDIMEGMAWGPHKQEIHSGIITTKDDQMEGYSDWFPIGVNPSEGFHTYSLDWTPKTLTMFFDGRQMWQKPTPESMKQPMYLIINLAVGGKWPYNEVGIKPIDGISPERLEQGADTIEADYPAELIIKSINVKQK